MERPSLVLTLEESQGGPSELVGGARAIIAWRELDDQGSDPSSASGMTSGTYAQIPFSIGELLRIKGNKYNPLTHSQGDVQPTGAGQGRCRLHGRTQCAHSPSSPHRHRSFGVASPNTSILNQESS